MTLRHDQCNKEPADNNWGDRDPPGHYEEPEIVQGDEESLEVFSRAEDEAEACYAPGDEVEGIGEWEVNVLVFSVPGVSICFGEPEVDYGREVDVLVVLKSIGERMMHVVLVTPPVAAEPVNKAGVSEWNVET